MKWYVCPACGKKHHRNNGSDHCNSDAVVRAVHAVCSVGEGLAVQIAFDALHGVKLTELVSRGVSYQDRSQPMISDGGSWRAATRGEIERMALAALNAL